MATYRGAWSICGGWAVDAWLGRETRDHGDIDISVFHDDRQTLFEHLDGWQLVAHDLNVDGATAELWDGRRLDLPAHIHARFGDAAMPARVDAAAQQGFSLDIQMDDRSGRDWILRREPRIRLPLRDAVRQSPWELPAAVPEVLLFFKASGRHIRRRDELDLLAVLPHLTDEQRDWLRNAISLVGHPWLPQLSA